MTRSEATTRKDLIDPQLAKAGWNVNDTHQVGLEIPVDGYDAQPWNGVTDYCLYSPNGDVIAVVEAKRQSRDPRVAEQQVRHYVTEIEKHQSFRPFAFLTNGNITYFWDVENSPKRQVAGFFSLRDLENLLYIRQNKINPSTLVVNRQISGRTYQQEAIQRVIERFEDGFRRGLIVMATGTGKTRTIMGLIDLLIRSNHLRTVLFVADRDVLVRQALDDNFRVYLPDEPSDRIRSYNIDYSKRLYVGTLQTLTKCCRNFTPGFFDLIIFDECHRSIYNQFREVLDYFDGKILGLTATPATAIDRNTFQAFHCFEGIPTFLYEYQQAINDGNLVDYSLYQAQTHFQREGIRGANLDEEDRNMLIEQGIDPDDIDYEGTELEKKVSNRDTLRKQWTEIMEVCHKDESGQLPGKTIIFAVTQKHAHRLKEVFDEMYPQFSEMVQVIVSEMEKTKDLIDKFKKEEMPRIAISVDLMDTGVDIPEVVNLVFMKPVQSFIKLQQMIGRGTRNHEACKYLNRLPNGKKDEFLIIDFWENEFDRDPSDEVISQNLPITVKLFNTRLRLLGYYLDNQESSDEQNQDVKGDLYEYLLGKLNISGRNGQFRTPRHIIRLMVEMVDPKPNERIGDLAAGTCGFLVNSYQYILEKFTSPEILLDEMGNKHPIGDLLTPEESEFLEKEAFTAYDNDSGMTMLRIGSMNLMLHGIKYPRFFYQDTLSKEFKDEKSLDVALMNPPFKGKMDEKDINPYLPTKCKKTELLFLYQILRVLEMGGRCGVIVPDGVLFGSSKQHQDIRQKLIEENRLDGVVSMPSGVFKPYAGVSTAILLFTKGATTDRIWFYDMEHDGFSLDDKRQPIEENDIPDILDCWRNRFDNGFSALRESMKAELSAKLQPLKEKRLQLQEEIHRLRFEDAIASEDEETPRQVLESAEETLKVLEEEIKPLQGQINRLSRQFWVDKQVVKGNKYDLSASRYRHIEQDEVFYESPHKTMERLLKLEHYMANEVTELNQLLGE